MLFHITKGFMAFNIAITARFSIKAKLVKGSLFSLFRYITIQHTFLSCTLSIFSESVEIFKELTNFRIFHVKYILCKLPSCVILLLYTLNICLPKDNNKYKQLSTYKFFV